MTGSPAVSIVTAAWNAEYFLEDTIRSVQQQSMPDWEHIIVDDGSTDATLQIAMECGDHRSRILRQENAGQSAAQNTGLREVRSPLVVMLDADDLLRPDALARLKSALEMETKSVLAFGHVWLMDTHGACFMAHQTFGGSAARDRLPELLQRNIITTGGSAMIRTRALREVGGFNENLTMAQDWECWVRLAACGPFSEIGGEAVLEYRLRVGSVARSNITAPERSRPAVDLMFSHPKVIERFSPTTLVKLRRRCDAQLSYMAGTEALRYSRYLEARRHLLDSLGMQGGRWKTWLLLACALLGWIPRQVGRRIGVSQSSK